MDKDVFNTLLIAAVGLVLPFITWLGARRYNRAQADEKEAKIAGAWQDMLRKEQESNEELRCRVRVLEDEFRDFKRNSERRERELMRGILILTEQVVRAGDIPDWRPNGDG